MDSGLVIMENTVKEVGTINIPERVRRQIALDIENGLRLPGTALDEKQIAEQFGVSRTPVREALLMLAMQKLVDIVPRSGAIVHRPSADELIALLELLGELEGVAARLAASRMTREQRELLAQINQHSESLVRAGEIKAYEQANLELHTLIQKGSGNFILQEDFVAARSRLANFRKNVFERPGRISTSFAEHQPIVEAILSNRSEAAADAMRDHIIGKGKAFTDLVLVSHAG